MLHYELYQNQIERIASSLETDVAIIKAINIITESDNEDKIAQVCNDPKELKSKIEKLAIELHIEYCDRYDLDYDNVLCWGCDTIKI